MHCFPFDCYADSTEKSSVDAHCFDLPLRVSDPNTVKKRNACVAVLAQCSLTVCGAASVRVLSGLTLFRPFSNPKRASYG